ncbi:hypothetical protein GUJ93_ZPchr0002g25837 [Zizania palustris]|uniref:Uncharacterized protein n=1 Tax=Zizania palustris TaxID=103762 RepID=A0A8J5SN26_ZIZPA|nr:hypothetical protein GUJ93_ZPchr0002g25837 [Zizania palustris]
MSSGRERRWEFPATLRALARDAGQQLAAPRAAAAREPATAGRRADGGKAAKILVLFGKLSPTHLEF